MLAAGVDPALVVRFGLAEGANEQQLIDRLADAGLQVVAVEPDKHAVVAFRANDDFSEFTRALDAYRRGPAQDRKSTKWDIFEFIEPSDVRRWSREDRIGQRLQAEAGDGVVTFDLNETYKLDVELWHAGTREAAARSLEKIRKFVDARRPRARLLDSFVGNTLCLARVALQGRDVDALLEVPDVAEVDLPPRVAVDPLGRKAAALVQQFPTPARPPEDGPRVCILDSGVTSAHPLLRPFVGDASSFHSAITSAADLTGHGTAVGSVAVFGDLRRHLEAGDFSSSITLFSARLLDDGDRLDEDKLVVTQVRAVVERYREPPFNCRVYNLSFGEERTFLEKTGGRQGIWGEVLDLLAAEYDIVFVVSAGNVNLVGAANEEAEALVVAAGTHLQSPEHRLVDPATSAIALTVGSIAERSDMYVPPGSAGEHDIARPLVNRGYPSPFTRVGPGINGAIKPDVVEDGGNLLWQGSGSAKRVVTNDAASVLLLSNKHSGIRGWFQYDVGTSFAAPRVARVAALLEHSLRVQTGAAPSANLVRALIGAGAVACPSMDERCVPGATTAFTGYGRADEDFALSSSDNRVVMFADEVLPLDHFAMFELPVPAEFFATRGVKTVAIALAYDPPVRARRSNYLGVELELGLYRGIDQEPLFATLRKADVPDSEQLHLTKYRVSVTPTTRADPNFQWSRNRSTLQVVRCKFQQLKHEQWWLVVKAWRKWAPREVEKQRFAVAVVLESAYSDLYGRVQAQLRTRTRARARA